MNRDQLLVFCNPNLEESIFAHEVLVLYPCSPSVQFRHAPGGDCKPTLIYPLADTRVTATSHLDGRNRLQFPSSPQYNTTQYTAPPVKFLYLPHTPRDIPINERA